MPKHATKLISAFVLAFLCLNAGGALCLAYCSSAEVFAINADHCPLQRSSSSHCDVSEPDGDMNADSANGAEFDCCQMAAGFIPGPVEKRPVKFHRVATSKIATIENPFPSEYSLIRFPGIFNHRGPPPLDRRPDRIKHGVIRI